MLSVSLWRAGGGEQPETWMAAREAETRGSPGREARGSWAVGLALAWLLQAPQAWGKLMGTWGGGGGSWGPHPQPQPACRQLPARGPIPSQQAVTPGCRMRVAPVGIYALKGVFALTQHDPLLRPPAWAVSSEPAETEAPRPSFPEPSEQLGVCGDGQAAHQVSTGVQWCPSAGPVRRGDGETSHERRTVSRGEKVGCDRGSWALRSVMGSLCPPKVLRGSPTPW